MRRKLCLVGLLALVAPFALPQTASAAKTPETARILVQFNKSTGAARQQALIGRVDGRRVATVHRLGTAIVRVPAAEKWRALALLRRQAGVSYAEADGIVHAFLAVNDPYSIAPYASWPLANPLFPEAWDITTGDPTVTVAVVDSGVQSGLPDMGALTAGYDFVNNDSDPADDEGHGTAVAGVIAAQGNNGIGIAGICWKCQIMPVKVLDSTGSGTDSWVASGITWAVDHGADVINMSLGGTENSSTLAGAVSYALENGVVVVAAAGNDGIDPILGITPNYPAAYSGVISVGGDDETNTRYVWSNHGPWVEVDAPGLTNSTGWSGSYVGFAGTSAASPFVAGLAGLARSYNLPATGSSVTSAIESTAQAATIPSGNSAHGLIDAQATLVSIASAPAGPVASFSASTASGTFPLAVSFSNTSTNAISYSWSFGDGTSSTATSPTHTFTAMGSYNVTLKASDGSSWRLANAVITVAAPAPLAAFAAGKSSGRAPLTISFSNKSSNATSYAWSFGDGSSSSDESPTHTFRNSGTFTVTLTATGLGGTATATRTINVSKALPDLALSLSRKSSKLKSGYRLSSFVVKLRNRGAAADGRVKVTIKLPSGSSFAGISSRGRKCTRTTRRVVCSFGTLKAGKSAKFSFAARVTRRVTVKAVASGKNAEISRANNTARARTR
jgi:PKD repeat protein